MSLADELGYDDVFEIHVERGTQGFGFNIKGTTQAGGVLQAINGRLYPPLQYISHVDEGGAAWRAGLRCWDRVLSVNNTDVRGASHNEVVKNIIRGGESLDLIVIRVDDEEAARLQRLEDAANSTRKGRGKSAPISIQDFNNLPNPAGKGNYTVFNVYTHGDYRTSKRYSELANLHKQLKARFRWHNFPPFPPKKMNGLFSGALGPSDLEQRREALQIYLQKVYEVEDIRNSELFAEFLKPSDYRPPNAPTPSPPSSSAVSSSNLNARRATATSSGSSAAAKTATKQRTDEAQKQPQQQEKAKKQDVKKTEEAKRGAPASSTSTPKDALSTPSSAKKKAVPANLFDFDDEEPEAVKELSDDDEQEAEEEAEQAQEEEQEQEEEEEEQEEPAAVEEEEEEEDAAVQETSFAVLVPTGDVVRVSLSSDATVADVLQAALDKLGVEGFARNIFALFESTTDTPSTDPLDHEFDHKLDDDELAASVSKQLLLRRWLFTTSQEPAADTCSAAVSLLVHQAINDIKQGRLYCTPKKKQKLLDSAKDLDTDKYPAFLGVVRKLKMYGGVLLPPCTDDDANSIIVTVTADRLILQKTDDDGNPSTDDEDVSVFEFEQLSKVRRRDDLLGFKATGADGEQQTVKLTSEHAAYMETCIKRAFMEQKWADGSAEGGFFQ
ncbi:hypothetical protein PTSG_00235 [Salpingoeca rosetta]|uniref:PX domain-containing protein n=1 Tax=Salpingoeca rosetta (strain ATCC 50818 / BSB-021) TaxID=946362 RepID=F2TVW8_SALR5|nr:uncharacterized protein PTSG_00235 [Salpingoeca rosetta]EGD72214.1 hypothetical protein PTSG_00235 [Salpingoeca rosetta]|eukprot:XP_004998785.1 hypothetical protein PTSG_00235 [Salpingoeca rosetta]